MTNFQSLSKGIFFSRIKEWFPTQLNTKETFSTSHIIHKKYTFLISVFKTGTIFKSWQKNSVFCLSTTHNIILNSLYYTTTLFNITIIAERNMLIVITTERNGTTEKRDTLFLFLLHCASSSNMILSKHSFLKLSCYVQEKWVTSDDLCRLLTSRRSNVTQIWHRCHTDLTLLTLVSTLVLLTSAWTPVTLLRRNTGLTAS